MDGLINLNKPGGITSAKALYRVRKLTGQRKSGHAGTLDPAAEGVLLLCLGKATKLVERIMDLPKVYRAAARLDVTSESFDSDRPLIPCHVERPPTLDELRTTLTEFEGHIEQIPPAISAVKIGGQPAYKLQRGGKVPLLKARTVRIDWIRLHEYEWPRIDFEMACGRGTYVRALLRDLGQRLHTGGCLTGLTRTAIGPFRIDDAQSIDQIEHAREESEYFVPLERARELLSAWVPAPSPPPPLPRTTNPSGSRIV